LSPGVDQGPVSVVVHIDGTRDGLRWCLTDRRLISKAFSTTSLILMYRLEEFFFPYWTFPS